MFILKKNYSDFRLNFLNKRILHYENKKFLHNCSNSCSDLIKSKLERDILVYSHTVEKALSHKNIRPGFGKEMAENLLKDILLYEKMNNTDDFILNLGKGAVNQYIKANKSVNCEVFPDVNFKTYDVVLGVVEKSQSDFFAASNSCFSELAKGRNSLRLYDSKSEEIGIEEIIDAIKIASESPSACNRQSSRVYVVQNRDKIANICKIQGGAKGFGENCGALLLITSNLNLYEVHERRLPMFDITDCLLCL